MTPNHPLNLDRILAACLYGILGGLVLLLSCGVFVVLNIETIGWLFLPVE